MNTPQAQSTPQVTVIVVPRERFSMARESLESLLNETHHPYKLLYVDNNSPAKLRRYLAGKAESEDFEIVRSDRYLSPNAARNLALKQVTTPYVAFVDNDVIFAPGWLEALVNCSEATGATVVGSLVCQYRPVHEIVHCIGGHYLSEDERDRFIATQGEGGGWTIEEVTPLQNQRIEEVGDRLQRSPTDFVEFHSMLVRTEIFDRIGLLDEGFPCTKEYIDFGMAVTLAGGSIYFEPTSVVTFLTHPPAPLLAWSDLPYFMLRWSDAWERENLLHFQAKWNLANSKYFQRRLTKLGWRRRKALIDPIMQRFDWLNQPTKTWLKKRLVTAEKQLNRWVTDRHDRAAPAPARASQPDETSLSPVA
ncbi:MAG: glycosyltransferase [Cyanobacteria bacterium J06639_1]